MTHDDTVELAFWRCRKEDLYESDREVTGGGSYTRDLTVAK
jgi:hypothetical protein